MSHESYNDVKRTGSKRVTPKNGKKVSTPRKYTMLMWHICLSNARGQQYDFNLILFRP